jgi:hypothetical protein
MSTSRGALGTCFTILAFLFLAYLAFNYYSNNSESKINTESSSLYQKGEALANTVWSYAKAFASLNIIKNVGVGNASLEENIKKEIQDGSLANSLIEVKNNQGGIINSIGALLKNELITSSSTKENVDKQINNVASGGLNSYDIENNRPLIDLTNSSGGGVEGADNVLEDTNNIEKNGTSSLDLKKEISSFINYKKTGEGAEIIFSSKSGQEYKIPLPFKFLAQ